LRDSTAVPLIVVSHQDDQLAAINAALREAGHPVHCRRVQEAALLEEAIAEQRPDLILLFADEPELDLTGLGAAALGRNPPIPLVMVRQQVTERALAEALAAGARDVVSLAHRGRLQAVVERELHTQRLQRALDGVVSSASQYQRELRQLMTAVPDAIADVQEGIVVSANPAWLEIFGLADEQLLIGQPFMDQFEPRDQAALKNALSACHKGKWADTSLLVSSAPQDGPARCLELRLERVTIDGEPAVRITIPAERPASEPPPELAVEQALCKDSSTGLLLRHHFLEQMNQRLQTPARGGVRAIAYLRPDSFSRVHADVGLLGTEALLMKLADLLREFLLPMDLCARFGGTIFTVLLERGTMGDVEAWAEQVRKAVAGRVFEVDHQSTTLTCAVGVSEVPPGNMAAGELLAGAEQACRSARDGGGNRVQLCDQTSATQKVRTTDALWVPRIRAALMQNRFRLLHQPIASLQEDVDGMFDTLVRMLDESDNPILPSEFIPAAERAGMIKSVDRWVIGASLSFCASRKPALVFVRLSRESVIDATLPDWLASRARNLGVQPAQLCFQVSESVATQQVKETRDLSNALQAAGFRFAIDHVGTGRDSAQLLSHVPMQFMKIDGSLMQGIAADADLQQRVANLTRIAQKLGVRTIAERVEDARTMAVLWQLGIAYFQGNFVQTRSVVLESGQSADTRRYA
jgi:diguanylate cyclase (GGDEF)-like protein/PAS domain S-box-containing protein